jgi:hypothetical protein
MRSSISILNHDANIVLSMLSDEQEAADFNKGLDLIRDQEAVGSNPIAPTNLLESATYKMRKSIERLVQG